MKHEIRKNAVLLIGGLLLLAIGIALLLWVRNAEGILEVLPYLCVGIGSGLFGQGMGSWIGRRQMKKNPQIAHELEIEKKDERNIAVANRAKAKAFDTMIYTFAALLVAFTAIGAPVAVVLLMVAGYLFVIGSQIYYLKRYNEEM